MSFGGQQPGLISLGNFLFTSQFFNWVSQFSVWKQKADKKACHAMKMEEHRHEAATHDHMICSFFLVAWTLLSTGVKHTLTTMIFICFSTSLFWKRMFLLVPRKQHTLYIGDSSQSPEPMHPLLPSQGKSHRVTSSSFAQSCSFAYLLS